MLDSDDSSSDSEDDAVMFSARASISVITVPQLLITLGQVGWLHKHYAKNKHTHVHVTDCRDEKGSLELSLNHAFFSIDQCWTRRKNHKARFPTEKGTGGVHDMVNQLTCANINT